MFDEEMNKKNDDLFSQIIYLKRNLRRVENELNRTKTEKDASDFYIRELEKELFKLNMDNSLNMDNNANIDNKNNRFNDSKKRMINSVKMRDFGRYHDMLNRSFEVLDSVSNQCNDPKGKTKGGVNYYFNRNQDYNNVIDSQKKWIDNLPQSNEKNNGTFKESDQYSSNKFGNSIYNDDNNSNLIKYPDSYNTMNQPSYNNSNKDQSSYNNSINQPPHNKKGQSPYNNNRGQPYNNNINNSIPKNNNKNPNYINNNKRENPNKNINPSNNNFINNNSYPDQIKEKMNSILNNPYDNNLPNNFMGKKSSYNPKNNTGIPHPKKVNQKKNRKNKRSYF